MISFLKPNPQPVAEPGGDFLSVGSHQVPVLLVRNRRARRYVLRLRPDGVARVTVPRGGSAAEARRFAERNEPWLARQLQKLATRSQTRQPWTVGTEILLRGETVKIEACPNSEPAASGPLPRNAGFIRQTASQSRMLPDKSGVPINGSLNLESGPQMGEPNLIRFSAETIHVADVHGDLRAKIERHLWNLAANEFPPRVFELAAIHQLTVRRVTVRNQRSRWGSCSRRGTISLNWRLIQAPSFVLDYLICHELAHLRQMNHSPRFWQEVERLCPNYPAAEQWLRNHSWLLNEL